MTFATSNLRRAAAFGAAAALALTACSSDEPEADSTPSETESPTPSETEEAMGPDTYDVTASDYAFDGIPAEMAAGSTLTLTNSSEVEVHELVAINLGDDDRPLVDIMVELEASLSGEGGEEIVPALVVIQGPGGEPTIPAIGDGTLTEPGRYLFICAIQQGVAPDAYFAEAGRMQEAGEEGPVFLEDGGAPHVALGMVAEAQVS